MANKLIPIAKYNKAFDKYLPYPFDYEFVYQSNGLVKHIAKRHPECLQYVQLIPSIIASPDYIGINPHEAGISFELVKVMTQNVQVGIKLDVQNDYLYVATLHTITNGKLQHSVANGRLKKI